MVWYLAQSAICPTSHNYPLVTGPVRSEAISTPWGAYSPAAIFSTQNYSNTQAFTVLPGTHLVLGRESARVSKVPSLEAQHQSIFSAAGDRTHDLSLHHACYHWATTSPHHNILAYSVYNYVMLPPSYLQSFSLLSHSLHSCNCLKSYFDQPCNCKHS